MGCSTKSSTASKPGRKPGARSTVHLGTRPWIEPGVEDIAEARTAFLFAVQRHAPEVLAGLLPAFRACGEERAARLFAWAQRFHLVLKSDVFEIKPKGGRKAWTKVKPPEDGQPEWMPEWLVEQARTTFAYWSMPEFSDSIGKDWVGVVGAWTCETGIAPERLAKAAWLARQPRYSKLLRQLHQPPNADLLPQKQLALRYRNAMGPLAKELGLEPRPAPLPWEFFAWAARHQCAAVPIGLLASEHDRTEAAVRRGVNVVLRLCGLTRRGRSRRAEAAKSKPAS